MPITQPTMTASLRRRVLIIESRLLIPGIEPAVQQEARARTPSGSGGGAGTTMMRLCGRSGGRAVGVATRMPCGAAKRGDCGLWVGCNGYGMKDGRMSPVRVHGESGEARSQSLWRDERAQMTGTY